MGEVLDTVAELSWMHRNLGAAALEALREDKGNYVHRLKDVADRSFMHSRYLSGSGVGSPMALTYGAFSRVREQSLKGHFMYYREIPTPTGRLVMFPLKIIGITSNSLPIIDPTELEGSYSVVHAPNVESGYSPFNPTKMRIDMAFSVDGDNLVTVNGTNRATPKEYALFDDIVNEFETRVSGISDGDMRMAREHASLGR